MKLPAGFETARVLAFLQARTVGGLEAIGDGGYGRVVGWRGDHHWLELRFARDGTAVRLVSSPALPGAVRRSLVNRMFDLETDLTPFLRLAARDPILRRLVRRRPGLRRQLLLDPFEAAVRAVVGQLISVPAATTLVSRLVAAFGTPLTWRPDTVAFPTPPRLLADPDRLGTIGLTKAKVATLLSLAERSVADGEFWSRLRRTPALADRALGEISGIGPWTSAYIRYRGLADPDAFPSTDLGIARALEGLGVSRPRIDAVTDRWRPWRALAVPHLWAAHLDE